MKFRIWDYISKKFYYSDEVPITVFGKQVIVDGHTIVNYEHNRWTGLQDKNGKDVYENDIVRGLMWTFSRETTKVVEYDYEHEFELTDYNCFVDCEVVGNIYQNAHNTK